MASKVSTDISITLALVQAVLKNLSGNGIPTHDSEEIKMCRAL